ncbi:hypothetical protein L6164_019793 [Bauhinia variegata]|uniref:Uncharacterized protein n=1 Tax=Bauhinia variegata TaxID=167791 RepID=A0ACB9MUJ9_BAUVA|nr:hypothetical protein L6164_019793 [Bauhinia variegata]
MSHRKVHSHGSIPFSWEDKPGVSKTANRDYSIHVGLGSVDAAVHQKLTTQAAAIEDDKKIPLPPCPLQPPPRSTSGKGLRWQQDPFLVAYKECTKTDKLKKKTLGSANSKVRKTKSIFSCKASTDAKDDHFVKLPRLPRLPRDHRSRSLTLGNGDKHKLDFTYETWI